MHPDALLQIFMLPGVASCVLGIKFNAHLAMSYDNAQTHPTLEPVRVTSLYEHFTD